MRAARRSHRAPAGVLFILLLASVLFTGCFLSFNAPEIWLEPRFWYNDNQVLIPFEAWGDSTVAYIRYSFEHFDGATWLLDKEQDIQVPSGSTGVLQYDAPGGWPEYRLTFILLRSRDASAVPTPFLTEVRTFQIDPDPPGENPPGNVFNPNADLLPLPSPAPDPPRALDLNINVTDPVFFADGGSEIRLVYTTDGSVPTEWDRSVWGAGDSMNIWGAFEVGVGQSRVVRMMFIDMAGNRSQVWSMVYTGA